MLRFLSILATNLMALAAASAAADVAFSAPAGWSHVTPSGPSDPTRTFDQWHIAGDATTSVIFIRDASTTYDAALGSIQKNFADNKIKPSANKDLPCRGKTGHVVEFAAGPESHRILINRILVPDGAGVATITYSRPEGVAFDPEVQKSETAYCAAGT